MNTRIKLLTLGLLAVMAMSAVTVMNASATTGGHFVSDSPTGNTWVEGFESPTSGTHKLAWVFHGLGGEIVCHESSYKTTVVGATVTQVTVKPSFAKCRTVGGVENGVTVTMNNCSWVFTVAPVSFPDLTLHTADLECVAGQPVVEIHHPNCTVTVGPQNNMSGLRYTRVTEGGKHAITLDANIQFNTQFHGGICVLLGTNQTGTVAGSATVKGFEDKPGGGVGSQVNITAT